MKAVWFGIWKRARETTFSGPVILLDRKKSTGIADCCCLGVVVPSLTNVIKHGNLPSFSFSFFARKSLKSCGPIKTEDLAHKGGNRSNKMLLTAGTRNNELCVSC